jgi:hypothetical protein
VKRKPRFIVVLLAILSFAVGCRHSGSSTHPDRGQVESAEESARRAILNDTVRPFLTPEFLPTPRSPGSPR